MDRVVIVTKPTRLEELVLQHLTDGAAQFALESQGRSIDSSRVEHSVYHAALDEIRRQIPSDLSIAQVTREDLPNFLFREKDLIIVCGPDGLFANLAQYIKDQLVLTINPNPGVVAGVLMLFPPKEVRVLITRVQQGKHKVESLPFIKASFNDNRPPVWGINDIFIGRKDQVSAQYEISYASLREHQSSSGIIVSSGVGSTGWLRSIDTMVKALTQMGSYHELQSFSDVTSDELIFVVREPFPSPTTGTTIVTGCIDPYNPLVVTSEMPDRGFIFSDGVTEKAVEWNAGSTVTISVGDRYIQRIVS